MVVIFNSVQDLANSMVKINSSWVKEVSNSKLNKFPISCCYFLTLLDILNDNKINDLFTYINDETRTVEYPFAKDIQTNYSLMMEPDQFYNINLNNTNTNTNIKNISANIDEFLNIVNESDGRIIFVLDILYLVNFMIELKKKSIPNHLIDMILYKLTTSTKISEIYILDKQSMITNTSNLLYTQLEMCINKTIDEIDKKTIVVYKDIDETLIENVYWNILEPDMKITEHLGKVQSPYDNSYFNLMKIDEKKYFVKKIDIFECVDKNLYTLNDNPGIIIHPIDRLFV